MKMKGEWKPVLAKEVPVLCMWVCGDGPDEHGVVDVPDIYLACHNTNTTWTESDNLVGVSLEDGVIRYITHDELVWLLVA